MSSKNEQAPSAKRSWMRRIAWATIAGMLLLVGLFALRNRVLGPWMITAAARVLAEKTGLQLSVERVGGSWIRDLSLYDLSLVGSREQDSVRAVRVSELAFEASWWRLLRGRSDWLESIRVRDVRVNIDGTRMGQDEQQGGEAIEWPAQLPRLELSELALELELPQGRRVELSGLVLASLPSGRLELRVPSVDYTDSGQIRYHGTVLLSLSYEPDRISIVEGEVSLGDNRVRCSDLEIPLAAQSLVDLLRTTSGTIDFDGRDLSLAFGDLRAHSALGPASEHRLELSARFEHGSAAIESGLFETDQGQLVLRRGQIEWKEPLQASRLDLDLSAEFAELGPLGLVFGQSDWAGSLRGTVHLRGPIMGPEGSFDLSGEDVVLFDRRLGRIEIEARADLEALDIERVRVEGELGQLDAQGVLEFGTYTLSKARLQASIPALERVVPTYLERGALELKAELDGPWRRPSGRIEVVALGLERDGTVLDELRCEATLEEGSANVQSLVARCLGLELDCAGEVVAGSDGEQLVRVTRARLLAGAEDLVLLAPLEIEISDAGVSSGQGEFAGSVGGVVARFARISGKLEASVSFESCRPLAFARRWIPKPLALGQLDGTLALIHDVQELRVDCDVQLLGLQVAAAPPMRLELRGRMQAGRVEVEQLLLAADDWQLSASGSAPLDPMGEPFLAQGPIDLSGSAQWTGFGLPESAVFDVARELSADFELGGDWADLRARVDLSGAPSAKDTTLSGVLSLDRGLRVDALQFEAPGLRLRADGNVAFATDVRAWIEHGLPPWQDLPLSLEASGASENLEFLAQFLPGLRRTAGSFESQFQVAGTWVEPDLQGRAEFRGFELRTESGAASLDACNASLLFEGSRVVLESMDGEFGAGPFRAEGWFELDPDERYVNVEIQGDELLLARSGGLRLRADCNLVIAGPPTELAASGSLELRDGRYTRDVDFFTTGGTQRRARGIELFSLRGEPLASMTFDIAVTAKDPFRVENNVVSGALRPEMRLIGTGAAPELMGTIYLDPTRISLPATKLELSSGTILFEGGNPLIPSIEVFGQTRMRGFDVRLHASGPYDDAKLSFTSVPPLSEEQLRVLVLTGQTPEQALSASGSQRAAKTVAVFLGRDLISSWFGGEREGESVLDRIEFETGKEVSRTGVEASGATFRLTGKRIGTGRSMLLRAERDIYERINFGLRFLFRLK